MARRLEGGDPVPDLVLSPAQVETLGRWARESFPEEACGLFLGLRGAGSDRVVRVLVSPNRSPGDRETSYMVAPEVQLEAMAWARDRGLEVLGAWHSHPGGGARPSPEDDRRAWPGWTSLIMAVRGGDPGALRAWSATPGKHRERRISIQGAGGGQHG